MKCGPDECPIVTFSDLTPAEQREQRQRKAKEMYDRGFTMEQIAKQFGVGKSTIERDLADLPTMGKSKPTKTASNPKGAGRPKGKKSTKRRTGPARDVEQKMAAAVLDEGKTLEQVTREFDQPSVQHAKIAVAKEEGRREAVPEITPEMLSMTAQEKLDAAIRQHQRKVDLESEVRVRDEVKSILDRWLPGYHEKLLEAERVINAYQGIMPRAHFRKILACLHSDRGMSDKTLNEAFHIFEKLESVLVKKEELDRPTNVFQFPRTYEEAMQMKRDVSAQRKSKKAGAVQLA